MINSQSPMQAQGLSNAISTKSIQAYVFVAVAVMGMSQSALAGPFDDAIKSDRDKTKSLTGNQGAAEQGLGSLYNIGKYIAIVIGLFMAIGGLISVRNAAKTDGQKSQMPGWSAFGIGGLLTVVGFFMFAIGKTAQNVIGADA